MKAIARWYRQTRERYKEGRRALGKDYYVGFMDVVDWIGGWLYRVFVEEPKMKRLKEETNKKLKDYFDSEGF